MSVQAITWALSIKTGSPNHKWVLVALSNYANSDGESWYSQKRIGEDTELGRRSVMRSLAFLELHGLLSRTKRYRADGTRSTDFITLHLSETRLGAPQAHGGLGAPQAPPRCPTGTDRVPDRHSRTVNEPSMNHQLGKLDFSGKRKKHGTRPQSNAESAAIVREAIDDQINLIQREIEKIERGEQAGSKAS